MISSRALGHLWIEAIVPEAAVAHSGSAVAI